MIKQITKAEYNETVEYYKSIKRLPHPLMVTCRNKDNTKFTNAIRYLRYEELTTDVKVILNDYRKAR